ncbi:hypothetical protein [Streptomyces sp. NRRL F-5135]|uniref:hypothetical protein n=1 Tax=Streptomyces sp. NRRL F-5135 TaxID=1463858 RepID=UPI0004CA5679|nr:hypothetical protein [Streptomyces sp. NRRL F-5135]
MTVAGSARSTAHLADPISRWLADVLSEPDTAWEDWDQGRPAILRTGVRFDAVRMHPDLVHAAVGHTSPEAVAAVLAVALTGPVICHPGVWYYALVPAQTSET